MIQDSLLNVLAGNYENIYIACGRTDLRKGIDGLVAIIQTEFKLNPYSSAMFLFCGNRADKIKAIVYDIEGFTLLYKRLEHGQFKWPRNSNDAMQLNLFNEAEAFARENEEEPVLEEVKAHYRKKRISAKDRLPEDMPIEVIEHKLNVEETNCPQCKQELHEIGKCEIFLWLQELREK